MCFSKERCDMKREEVLKSPEYWKAKTQIELYNLAEKFMAETGRNKSQLAEYLGVSKGYVSQLLNGDYDHRMSKFFELALAFGMVPQIEFVPVNDYVEEDKFMSKFKKIAVTSAKPTEWKECNNSERYSMVCKITACPAYDGTPKIVA